jgi:predicted nucleic-acid-binding protein
VIGVDTNVLLRLILNDDPDQSRRARVLLSGAEAAGMPVLVNLLVLAETVWVLRRSYRFSRERLLDVVDALTQAGSIAFDRPDAVAEALSVCRSTTADLPDALSAAYNRHAGCSTTYTFDKDAAALPGCSPVPPA